MLYPLIEKDFNLIKKILFLLELSHQTLIEILRLYSTATRLLIINKISSKNNKIIL